MANSETTLQQYAQHLSTRYMPEIRAMAKEQGLAVPDIASRSYLMRC